MILYGASGHAKVIIDICKKNKNTITAIIDDNKDITNLLSYKVGQLKNNILKTDSCIISIGNNYSRKKVAQNIQAKYGKAIHPNTTIDPTVKIDEGTVVMAGSVINATTKIGKHCIVNSSATIDHDCVINDFVHISPNATVCGGISIDEGTHIGAGVVIIPNIKIGKWCIIGAGAVVTKNIVDGDIVVGNPARSIKK